MVTTQEEQETCCPLESLEGTRAASLLITDFQNLCLTSKTTRIYYVTITSKIYICLPEP